MKAEEVRADEAAATLFSVYAGARSPSWVHLGICFLHQVIVQDGVFSLQGCQQPWLKM